MGDLCLSRRTLLLAAAQAFGAVVAGALLQACGPPAGALPAGTSSAAKTAASSAPAAQVPKGGTLTFAARQDVDTLDPHRFGAIATRKVLGQLFDPLLRAKHGDPKVYPGLAEAWTASEDGKTYTLKLKKGVKFRDGTPFNAEAVKFTLDRINDLGSAKGVAKSFLGPYRSSEVVDDSTVKVTLEGANLALPTILAMEALSPISPAAVKKYGEEGFGRNPVGTGPFMFKEWVEKDHITLVKNPDYNWAPEIFDHQGPAYLDVVNWRLVPEATTRVAVLETGEIDIAEDIAYQDVQRVRDNPRLKVANALPAGTPWAALANTKRFPTDQLSVRRALQFAIDKEAIIKSVYKSETKPALSLLQPTTFAYAPTIGDLYKYDPEKAKAILEEDGWKLGADGVQVKDGKRLEILFVFYSGGGFDQIVPLVQGMVRKVGMAMKLQEMTIANWFAASRAGDHKLSHSAWWFPDPLVIANWSHSRTIGAYNYSFYANPEVDKLLDAAVTVSGPKRVELYKQIQEQVAKDAAVIPIAENVTIVGLKKAVEGYKFNTVALPLLYDVHL